jgi:penicillin-binding protein 1C
VGGASSASLTIVFPEEGSKVYVPTEIDGTMGSMVAVAAHSEQGITLFWDLDGEYLGETKGPHEIAISPRAGGHTLAITDSRGNRVTRRFTHLRE